MRKIKITVGGVAIKVALLNTPTADAVYAALPIEATAGVVEYGGATTAYDFPVFDGDQSPTRLLSSYGGNNWIYNAKNDIQGRRQEDHFGCRLSSLSQTGSRAWADRHGRIDPERGATRQEYPAPGRLGKNGGATCNKEKAGKKDDCIMITVFEGHPF